MPDTVSRNPKITPESAATSVVATRAPQFPPGGASTAESHAKEATTAPERRGETSSNEETTPTRGPYGQVEAILSGLTLDEKIGQLFLVYFEGPILSPSLREMITDYHIGGILLFGISGNIENPAQVARLVDSAQQQAVACRPGLALFVGVDQEGGPVVRLTVGSTVFPSNMAVGATGSAELAALMADTTAAELKALGINVNLAPVLDVNSNPANPVIGIRSFGSSPEEVARLGTAMISAYKRRGVIATAKHFPGHGDTAVDSHVGLPIVNRSRDSLDTVELVPFRAAIANGVEAIMTAHIEVPAIEPSEGLPATLSARILDGLLRRELGFQGLIVTDSLGMNALNLPGGAAEAAVRAFQAGADLLAFGADRGHRPEEQRDAYHRMLDAVASGVISRARVDDSVRRILTVKARYGLLDWHPSELSDIPAVVGIEKHQSAAHAVAQRSITLLRDEPGLLPIHKDQTALVVWPRTVDNWGKVLSAYHGSLELLPTSLEPGQEEIDLAASRASDFSTVIVGTVDVTKHPSQAALVRALPTRRTVVVALASPYDLISFPEVQCYLLSYGCVPASLEAVSRVLFGLEQPHGRLPVELPGLHPRNSGMQGFRTRL